MNILLQWAVLRENKAEKQREREMLLDSVTAC